MGDDVEYRDGVTGRLIAPPLHGPKYRPSPFGCACGMRRGTHDHRCPSSELRRTTRPWKREDASLPKPADSVVIIESFT